MPEIDLSILTAYFSSQPDILFAVLFGSQAQGKTTPLSDLDIAVLFTEPMEPLHMANRQLDIICALIDSCKINDVDIAILNGASPFLRFQVVKEGRLLYAADEKSYFHYKAQSFGLYQDIKPMYDLYFSKTAADLNRGLHG